jgi:hypothetical protein
MPSETVSHAAKCASSFAPAGSASAPAATLPRQVARTTTPVCGCDHLFEVDRLLGQQALARAVGRKRDVTVAARASRVDCVRVLDDSDVRVQDLRELVRRRVEVGDHRVIAPHHRLGLRHGGDARRPAGQRP